MVLAFPKFEEIEKLSTLQEKQKAWLEDYKGLNFSIAENGIHTIRWAKEPKQYKIYNPAINCISPRKDRLIIEIEPNGEDLEKQYKEVKNKLEKLNAGYIRTTHKGKSDYLHIEFTRDLTIKEKKSFLKWVRPKENSIMDMNFAFEKKVFQVLYAVHWKHSTQRELPIEFFAGNKIDYDSLKIPDEEIKTTVVDKDGFKYHTLELQSPQSKAYTEEIELLTYKDFQNLKKNNNYIVEKFLMPESLTMIYSPPAMFKTILAQSMSMAITNNKEWLGLKTKKFPVLYLDGENSPQGIKDNLKGIYNAYKLKRQTFPLYFLRSGLLIDSKKNVHLGFMIALEKIIEEKEIKVLVFDTMHRFAFYDENKSDDINKLYTEVFKPLKEKYGLAIVFLHHSTKPDKRGYVAYRGSGDFLGMVDVSYRILADKRNKKFTITNEKNRSGEIAEIKGEILFEEDLIKITRLNEEVEEEETKSIFNELCDKIILLFDKSSELSRKDIITYLEAMKYEFSTATLGRALKWLVDVKGSLDKTGKGVYILR